MDKQCTTPMPATGYASAKTLARMFETTTTTIWRWTKAGKLPQPVKLGAGTTRWRLADVHEALAKLES